MSTSCFLRTTHFPRLGAPACKHRLAGAGNCPATVKIQASGSPWELGLRLDHRRFRFKALSLHSRASGRPTMEKAKQRQTGVDRQQRCMAGLLLVCLLSCLVGVVCLPACLLACLLVCLLARLLAYLLACLFACLLACLLAWLVSWLFAGLRT